MPDSLTHEQASSSHGDEPPDQEYEGPAFEEMDPSGRYGRVRFYSEPKIKPSLHFKIMHLESPPEVIFSSDSPRFFFPFPTILTPYFPLHIVYICSLKMSLAAALAKSSIKLLTLKKVQRSLGIKSVSSTSCAPRT
jgi:hypothetical protein